MKLAKKPTISLLIVLLTVITSSAQKVIINPVFGSAATSSFKIERIELTDSTTTLFFRLLHTPGGTVWFDSSIYLQTASGDKKYYIVGTKGIEVGMNKKWIVPDSGVIHYGLIFPKMDSSISKFDYIGNGASAWKIFDIRFNSKTTILPEELMGNWITKDTSGKWLIGLYDSIAIYNNKIWHYNQVNVMNNIWTVTLKDATATTTIYLHSDNEGNCFVGQDAKQEVLCSHKMININYHKSTPQKAAFQAPFFSYGYATIKGFIDGYSTRVQNQPFIATFAKYSPITTVNEDGTFEMKIPLTHPSVCRIDFTARQTNLQQQENIYLEPGKETICYFKILNNYMWATSEKYFVSPFLYMGDNAEVNSEFCQFKRKIINKDFFSEWVHYSEGDQLDSFKNKALEIKNKADDRVISYLSNNAISEKTAKILRADINVQYGMNLLSFNYKRESEYKLANHIKDNSKTYFTPETFGFPYLNPLKTTLQDTFSVISFYFDNLLYYAKTYLTDVKKQDHSLPDIMKQMKSDGIKFSKNDEALYNWFDGIHNHNRDAADSFDYYQKETIRFKKKYTNTLEEVSGRLQSQTPEQKLENYLAMSDFTRDLIRLKTEITKLNEPLALPLGKSDLRDLRKKFSNSAFSDYFETLNKQIGNTLTENEGSVLKSNRDIDPDDLLESLTKPYIGRVILLDFWETWCNPCRMGMQQMAPLKRELKDSSIAFVCVASPSSPEDTWKTLAKTISGDHYRLNGSQYSAFYYRFNLKSIPRYILINKEGKIVNSDLGHKTNEELKTILLKLKNE